MPERKWFESWFNSPYYHILYKERSFEEAKQFITKLTWFLALEKGSKVLDLPCGRGRHSLILNQLGYGVTGLDLSPLNIQLAKQFEGNNLHFDVFDMRQTYKADEFSAVFNLFTSFGYFDDVQDDIKVLKAIYQSLKPNGIFILDFMNVEKVVKNIVHQENKTISGISFHIQKAVENGFIVKHIQFTDKGKDYHFTEKVKALKNNNLVDYFTQIGFKIEQKFGSYDLEDFNAPQSDRLIYICRKEK